jgi:zinc/manganese transport system substrate-binding protein
MFRRSLHILIVALLIPLNAQAEETHRKLDIVASFSIIADMAKAVAGDAATVKTIVAPGGDVHVYEPSPEDIRNIAAADIILVNGLGFEGWLDRLMQSANVQDRVITVSKGVIPIKTDEHEDPHAWQDVSNGMIYVANIRDAFIRADPANADIYRQNAKQYLIELIELDRWVRGRIEEVPPSKRHAITSHDALHYFSRAYGIHFIAAQGTSTEGDISAKSMAALINQVRDKHVKAIFLENMSNPRLIQQLAEEGNATMGGTLYSDSLSDVYGNGATYISMFRHNVSVLTEALNK